MWVGMGCGWGWEVDGGWVMEMMVLTVFSSTDEDTNCDKETNNQDTWKNGLLN